MNKHDKYVLPPCAKICHLSGTACDKETCKYWIPFEKEQNCALISIEENGSMTLQEVGERLDLSFVRISQIEKKIKEKLKQNDKFIKLFGN